MPKTRTFIAVELAPDIRSRAQQVIRKLQPVAGDVKWVAPENMHWTLQFLGDVDDLETPAVCDVVAAAVADVEPFEIVVRGAGAFPSADRPRTLWLGAGRGANEMSTLQSAIELGLESLGFRGEARRFSPHVTLGRVGRGAPPRELADELTAAGRLCGRDDAGRRSDDLCQPADSRRAGISGSPTRRFRPSRNKLH